MKKLATIRKAPAPHWVGDGFPVRSIISAHTMGDSVSPFLLLDYAAPFDFPPTDERLGVDEHPHKGFETVTIVFEGEVEHRDSTGNHGKVGPGDVQWMTAGSGLVHEEKHSAEFARNGGKFHMIQLWVNLPAKDKSTAPGYQTLLKSDIPTVELPNAAGSLRVIAGEFDGSRGPARTFTPVSLWEIHLKAGSKVTLTVPDGHTTAVLTLSGEVRINGEERATESELAVFERDGSDFELEALSETNLVLLSGEPINEPVVAYGPFVMNTKEEIEQAIRDFQAGKMGSLEPIA
jgi:redox-sensitive bicupin YhaK (pirin superfamily)